MSQEHTLYDWNPFNFIACEVRPGAPRNPLVGKVWPLHEPRRILSRRRILFGLDLTSLCALDVRAGVGMPGMGSAQLEVPLGHPRRMGSCLRVWISREGSRVPLRQGCRYEGLRGTGEGEEPVLGVIRGSALWPWACNATSLSSCLLTSKTGG